jgi:hypothetical protein
MRNEIAFPFFTATAADVRMAPWLFSTSAGVSGPLEPELPGWDYAVDLTLVTTADIDVAAVRERCELGADAHVELVITCSSPPARFRRVCFRAELNRSENQVIAVETAVIKGSELAERLEIESELVLVQGAARSSPFAPALAGSRLFAEKRSISLEGVGSKFPIDAVDFRERFGSDGAWYLSWEREDLERMFMSGVQLLVNSRWPRLAALSPATDPELFRILAADISRQLISGALEDDDFVSHSDRYGDGTVGQVIHRLIRACFPNKTMADVRAMYKSRRSVFERTIQSAAGGWSA